jgi:hypothetical protein
MGPTGSPSRASSGSTSTARVSPGSTIALERREGRNFAANPKVSLLVVDPDNTGRFIQIRGDAELVTVGALEHFIALTRCLHEPSRLLRPHLPGRAGGLRETRVIVRIHARRILLDAIHA